MPPKWTKAQKKNVIIVITLRQQPDNTRRPTLKTGTILYIELVNPILTFRMYTNSITPLKTSNTSSFIVNQ